MEEELTVEALTKEQFLQSLAGQEVHGIPVGTAYPVPRREPVPGQELAKHRVKVSFDFDVICNDGPVRNLTYDEGGTMSMALLKSFLVANRGKLLDMMIEKVASELGYHPEAFLTQFFPQVDTNSRKLFKPAIEALEGDEKLFWHEQENDKHPDWFDYCVEELFECFSADFVKSDYQIVTQGQEA